MTTAEFDKCVAKFGGSSVADLPAMQACIKVLKQNPSSKVVVLSASMGVTNLLVELAQGLTEEERQATLQKIIHIQNNILNAIPNCENLRQSIDAVLTYIDALSREFSQNCSGISAQQTDELIALGEIMSSLIFVELLQRENMPAKWIDAREIILTDSQFGKAKPQISSIQSLVAEKLTPLLNQGYILVTQGFIGRDRQGRTTTLGRGGSDYSASLFAEALQAKEVHIWTDVAGIFTTDPRIVKNAQPLPALSFNEASEMSTFGAKVLHPATLRPAMRGNIPVYVSSSIEPHLKGSWITQDTADSQSFRAISLRTNQKFLTFNLANLAHLETNYLSQISALLAKYRVSIDVLKQDKQCIQLVLDLNSVAEQEILAEVATIASFEIEHDLALIALIGSNIQASQVQEILSYLTNYPIKMSCISEQAHSLCLLVEAKQACEIVKLLHRQLFEKH